MDNSYLTKDPKDIRLLADILALILDENKEKADSALEELRQDAQKLKISESTLKELFIQIAEHERLEQSNVYQEDISPDNLINRYRHLQSKHSLLQKENEQLHQSDVLHKKQAPLRHAGVCIAILVGLIIGIAGTQLTHSLTVPPRIDPALCLH